MKEICPGYSVIYCKTRFKLVGKLDNTVQQHSIRQEASRNIEKMYL